MTGTLADFAFASSTVEVADARHAHDRPGLSGTPRLSGTLVFRLRDRWIPCAFGSPIASWATATARPALELTVSGPTLAFATEAVVGLAGARMPVTLDGEPVPFHEPVDRARRPGSRRGTGAGARVPGLPRRSARLRRAGVPRQPFDLHAGPLRRPRRTALRKGDVLHLAREGSTDAHPKKLDPRIVPELVDHWTVGVMYGPHGAPDFFTERDIETFYATDWEVHYNSARTGVRLIGPKPEWARADGGEAGLHPSNIHDNAYAVGSGRLHGRHADRPRPGRPEPRRLRLPRDGRARRALEARPAQARRARALRSDFRSSTRSGSSSSRTTRSLQRGTRARAALEPWRARAPSCATCRKRASGRASCTGRAATIICSSSTGRSCSISRSASAFTRSWSGSPPSACRESSTSHSCRGARAAKGSGL